MSFLALQRENPAQVRRHRHRLHPRLFPKVAPARLRVLDCRAVEVHSCTDRMTPSKKESGMQAGVECASVCTLCLLHSTFASWIPIPHKMGKLLNLKVKVADLPSPKYFILHLFRVDKLPYLCIWNIKKNASQVFLEIHIISRVRVKLCIRLMPTKWTQILVISK